MARARDRPARHRRTRTLSQKQSATTPTYQTRRERRRAGRQERQTRRQQPPPGRPGWASPTVLITGGALLVGAVVIAFAVLTQGGGGNAGGDLVAPSRPVPADAVVDGATMGVAEAPVTLDVWSDFQCPACGVFALDTETLVRETFVADGTLRIVHHDAAFQGRRSASSYDESVEASAGAHCAGEQGSFWEFHDWLFTNQDGENDGAFARDRLQAIAERIGLDVDAWTACVDRGDVQPQVIADTDAAAADGIRLTPTIAVNGQRYEGAVPYDQLATIIRDAAAAASSVP